MSDEEKQLDYNGTGAKPKASRKTELTQRDRNCDEEKQLRCRNQGTTSYQDDCQSQVLPAQGATIVNIKHAERITINETVLLSNEKRRDLPPNDRQGSLQETVYQHIINPLEDEMSCIKSSTKSRIKMENKYMPSLLWEDEELNYPIRDYFVELQVEEKDLTGAFVNHKNIQLYEIFHSSDVKSIRFERKILITGDAGFGKTTLMQKLSYDWATPQPPGYISRFDMVVNIPLRTIGNRTIKQAILDYLHLDPSERVTEQIMSKKEINWLIILDGFDELVSKENQNKLFDFVEEPNSLIRGFSENSAIVVTSRPYPVKEICKYFDRYLSILGLSVDGQKKYIQTLFSPDSGKASRIISILQNDLFLKNTCECPLMLHMLCCVYGKSRFVSNITTRTSLYLTICELIVSRFVKKYGECIVIKGKKLQENVLFIKLGKIAQMYGKLQEPLTEDKLLKEFLEKSEFNTILRMDFLLASPKRYDMGIVIHYDFIHRTFSEFFEAIYIVDVINKAEETGSFDEALLSHLKLLTISRATTVGFLFGILGKQILQLKVFLNKIDQFQIHLQTLFHIRNEAALSDESWYLFCEHIKGIFYSHPEDKHVLCSRLIHISSIKCTNIDIRTKDIDEEFWNSVRELLNMSSSTKVFMGLTIDSPHLFFYSEKISYGVIYCADNGIVAKEFSKLLGIICSRDSFNLGIIISRQPRCSTEFKTNLRLFTLVDCIIINSELNNCDRFVAESPSPILCLKPSETNKVTNIIFFDDILQDFCNQCLLQLEGIEFPILFTTREEYNFESCLEERIPINIFRKNIRRIKAVINPGSTSDNQHSVEELLFKYRKKKHGQLEIRYAVNVFLIPDTFPYVLILDIQLEWNCNYE